MNVEQRQDIYRRPSYQATWLGLWIRL